MKASDSKARHPDDGALVRFLDHQASDEERRSLFVHLSECGECGARMEALRERSRALSRMVGALDVAAPDDLRRARALSAARRAQAARGPRRRPGAALRAAAVAAVAVGVTLGVQPVRAWVAERWSSLVGGEEAAAPVAVRPVPVLERGSVISFAPASETFVLEIEHAQEAGSVTLELRNVSEASAEVVNGRNEEIVVLPSGLRVANSSGSTASYHFTLPADLRLIQVFAGGRPVAILPVGGVSLPWSHTVRLDPDASGR